MLESKITADHLERDAYLYVRQSTLRQVAEHGESTQRQYALRDRAIAAGWPSERIQTIDCDLGRSGAQATDRDGFQHLVSEVALGKAGIVMGLEVSRLARNCADWHKLIELCAMTATIILDEDGIYNPSDFNDRLLLGLKGTMSEAELHVIKARLRGGVLNKARRGELKIGPPVGLIYRPDGRLDLDPDAQVQAAVRLVFDLFERTGSVTQTGSTTKVCCFRVVCAPASAKASCNGPDRNIHACFRFCTIHAMPEPLSMAGAGQAGARMVPASPAPYPGSSGRSFCRINIPPTSP